MDYAEKHPSLRTLSTMCQLDGKLAEVNSWLRCRLGTDATTSPEEHDDQRSAPAGPISSDIEQAGTRPLPLPCDDFLIGQTPKQPARPSPLDDALESTRQSVACDTSISFKRKQFRFKNLFKNPFHPSLKS